MITVPKTTWVAGKDGNVVRTKNISIESTKLKLARKAMCLFGYGVSSSASDGTDPGFQGTILGIVTDTTYAYVLTSASLFRFLLTDTSVSGLEAPSANAPTYGFGSDIVMYNGLPHVSGGQYVSSLNLGFSTWAARVISGLPTTVPHPLAVFTRANTLLVGCGNVLRQYSSAYVRDTANELTIPTEYTITTVRTRGSTIYIGTRHLFGGQAKVFLWNGTGVNNQAEYSAGADWIYSMTNYKSSIAITTSAGQILLFNGAGFDELDHLPVYDSPYAWTSTNADTYLIGRMTNRGMEAHGNTLYLDIDGTIANETGIYPGNYLPEQPSGLWVYKPKVGLYHEAGFNYLPRLRMTPTALNSSYLSFASPHQAQTGDPVICGAAATITGLTTGQVYYAIPGSTTTLRLALSPSDAYNNKYIVLSGSVSSDFFVFDRYETFGATYTTYPGAVFVLGRARPNTFFGSEVLFGAGLYDVGTTINQASLMSLGMGRNRGYLITERFTATGITDVFQKLYSFIEQLNLDTDQAIVKYRTTDRFGLPTQLSYSGGANWTSTTTFTVNTATYDFKSVQVGDEIEVIKGVGAGYTAHITTIDTTTSTYSVTVDETMPASSGNFDFIVDNWSKLPAITNTTPTYLKNFAEKSVGKEGTWVEFKIEMRGRNLTLDSLRLINVKHVDNA